MNGTKFESRRKKPAVGCRKGNHIKVVCAFDDETFREVRRRAVKEQTSVAEQIRKLTEWGLEAEDAGITMEICNK